ncbi:hypothetical protein P9209_03780 [Prescottella defluvii]|nr:hypothetical protein P9209_03780 [Prescottella defluvii]
MTFEKFGCIHFEDWLRTHCQTMGFDFGKDARPCRADAVCGVRHIEYRMEDAFETAGLHVAVDIRHGLRIPLPERPCHAHIRNTTSIDVLNLHSHFFS